ncbi:hypothetical protein [Sphingomonas sp. VNH70]|uniref:hypothetical protein n=1 Tax=Sphingomonas silueang TaxID=3156617 RepID=UPI0032B5D464
MMNRPLAAVAVLLLGACSAEPPAAADNAATQPVGSVGGVAPTPLPSVLPGVPEEPAPHPAPALQPMVRADFEDRQLLGAGCSFRAQPGGAILLMLRDEGDGLVKYDKRLRRISAATPGRAAISGGGIAAGEHVSFTIARAAGAEQPTGGWDATLTMRTDDGGETIYRGGVWECG